MQIHQLLLLLLIAGFGFAQNAQAPRSPSSVPGAVLDIPDTQLEAAQKANPDDLRVASKLLQYLQKDGHDPSGSIRFSLLTWYVEHHPEAPFFGAVNVYSGLPEAFRTQIKQTWITQVHQHVDNPAVLRNAAFAMAPPAFQASQLVVGGDVQAANLVIRVTPEYPIEAKQARIQGTVKMNVTIDPEGSVSWTGLVSGHPLLAQAAVAAVQKYRYKPTLLNGQPVSVATTVNVSFTPNP